MKTLLLTDADAQALMDFTELISGSPMTSSRVASDRIREKLREQGVAARVLYGREIAGGICCDDTFIDEESDYLVYGKDAGMKLTTHLCQPSPNFCGHCGKKKGVS